MCRRGSRRTSRSAWRRATSTTCCRTCCCACGLGALRDGDRFTSWMYRIGGSAIAERGGDRRRHPGAEGAEVAEVAESPSGPEPDRSAADALAGCLTIFVAGLPSPYREAMTLVELEGVPLKAAAAMGASLSAAKSRVQRGRGAAARHARGV